MANKIEEIKEGVITFYFQDNREISFYCLVKNKESVSHDFICTENMGELKSAEVVINGDNGTYDLCMECRTHLIKSRMIECPEGSGQLEPVEECTNPNCTNKA